MQPFQGCTAIVTGASAGIGREFARQLAPHARQLILIGRRLDRLETLKSELARPALTVRCHALDLANAGELEIFLENLTDADEVDLLVNNAGVGDHGLFEEGSWPRVQAMLDTNIRALTRLTHFLLPRLIRAHRGTILNVSSISAFMPVPMTAVYAATKAYVSSLTEALRAELRGTGVTVTALCPGPITTEFFARAERPGAPSDVPMPAIFKITAAEAAREGLKAAGRKRARVISGWTVWGAMMVLSLIPIGIFRLLLPGRERLKRFSQK